MILKSTTYKEKERILSNALARAKILTEKQEFSGTTPTIFVGRIGYPKINVGILAPNKQDKEVWKYDAPKYWAGTNLNTQTIVEYRTGMVNSRFKAGVKEQNKLVETAQEVAMAVKPTNIEVELENKPHLSIKTSNWTAPMGPQAKLKKLRLAENPKIPTIVQKFFYDRETTATEAITELYEHSIDENALSRMLSAGVFGKQRRLVPTRWSITATDDTLANNFLEKVRKQPIGECKAYSGSYLGNHYLILLLPEKWSYELFEMQAKPGMLEYSTDDEGFCGRKGYAENCAGGYYTVKMAIAEHLVREKKQNKALALRFITNEYVLPLGVWVTRETARKALESKPIKYSTKEAMINDAKKFAQELGVDITPILQKSKLLTQKTINNFI